MEGYSQWQHAWDSMEACHATKSRSPACWVPTAKAHKPATTLNTTHNPAHQLPTSHKRQPSLTVKLANSVVTAPQVYGSLPPHHTLATDGAPLHTAMCVSSGALVDTGRTTHSTALWPPPQLYQPCRSQTSSPAALRCAAAECVWLRAHCMMLPLLAQALMLQRRQC